MKKNIVKMQSLCVVILLAGLSCQSGSRSADATATPALLGYFTPLAPTDTLNFFLGSAPLPAAREVPIPVLYGDLDSVLFFQMGYMQDTAAMDAQAHGVFPLDAEYDAALLELQEGWFAFKYLLLFDKKANQFTHVKPVCEFFGGDGGQIRSESWLFFENPPKLLTRFSEHTLRFSQEDPDEVENLYYETAQMQEWLGIEWREVPVLDSSQWIKKFPVRWE